MKKLLFAAAGALVLATGLSACQTVVVQESAGEEDLTLRVVCQSPEVYQLYYTLYLDGEEYCQGGWGDIDGAPLTAQSDLTALFPQGYFEGRDLSGLAVDLSPYGEGDTREIATTPPVELHAQYGGSYTILFTGDEEQGFTAQVQEE